VNGSPKVSPDVRAFVEDDWAALDAPLATDEPARQESQ
jgi:hypothetical protein